MLKDIPVPNSMLNSMAIDKVSNCKYIGHCIKDKLIDDDDDDMATHRKHTCQPETTKTSEIFHQPQGLALSRQLSGKPHNPILEHLDSQHASFYWNKEVTLRFQKQLVALLEAPYIGQSALIRSDGMDATVVNSILREE